MIIFSSRVELLPLSSASSWTYLSRSTKLSFRFTIQLKDVRVSMLICYKLSIIIAFIHRESIQGNLRLGQSVISTVHPWAARNRWWSTGGVLQGKSDWDFSDMRAPNWLKLQLCKSRQAIKLHVLNISIEAEGSWEKLEKIDPNVWNAIQSLN